MVRVTNDSELVLILNAVHKDSLRILRDTKEKSQKRLTQLKTYPIRNRTIIELIRGPWFH